MSALASSLFGAGVRLRNSFYDRGWSRIHRLEAPVVSIGNLSTGGAGKTPFVMLLGELLRRRQVEFDILSRGYGRSSKGVALVDADGTARQFGDEPLLMARRLGVPVIVGEDRYEAGRFAERRFGPRLHLLDDAFQHRRLARDFDIVLLSPSDAQDRLLPAGRLREPLAALCRADAIVLQEGQPCQGLVPEDRPLWFIRRGICPDGVPPRPVAFCGIARPQLFFDQLRAAGIAPAAEHSFRDHHAYTRDDVAMLERVRRHCGAGGFVTTEKDALNLEAVGVRVHPLAAVPVTMELQNAGAALATMLSCIAERRRL